MLKPRVLLIHPALPPYRVDIFNKMNSLFSFELLLINENLKTQKFDQKALLEQLEFTPSYLNKKLVSGDRDIPLSIISKLRKANPDVVIATEFSFSTLVAAIYRKVVNKSSKLIILTDDNPYIVETESFVRGLARKVLAPMVDGWIFTSATTRAFYESRNLNQPCAVVPIIHREAKFRDGLARTDAKARELIKRHDLAGRRVLLSVGRLVEAKGIDLAIAAFAQAAASMPDAVFVIVGAGPKSDELQALVAKHNLAGRVLFVGRQEGDELAAWYRIGQVFALFSTFEPYGVVVNEALLSGMPVLVSRYAGSSDLVVDDVNGATIDPAAVEQSARAISHWLRKAPVLTDIAPDRPSLMQRQFVNGVDQVRLLVQTLVSKAAS